MLIYCRVCNKKIEVKSTVSGFSLTESGFEPDGNFYSPPAPWRSVSQGYLCSDRCQHLFDMPDRYRCGACGFVFHSEEQPTECENCNFYHCGDDQCCYGEPFYLVPGDED